MEVHVQMRKSPFTWIFHELYLRSRPTMQLLHEGKGVLIVAR